MTRKECLLIVPGIKSVTRRERFTTVYEFPRGALSLGTFLDANGRSVALLPLDYYLTITDDPREIEGQIYSIVESALREYEPLFVGVSAPYTMLYPISLKVLEFCKQLRPDVITVMGGPHVTFLDRQSLQNSRAVDVVVKGEGEWTLLDLINTIRDGKNLSRVKGITYRENGKIIANPPRPLGPINELPVLNYSLLPEDFVRGMAVSLVASRGCAYKCTYCSESVFWGGKVRYIPIENIVKEMRQLAEKYDNYPVGLEDSMFHMKSSYFFDLCSKLSQIRLNPNFYLLSRVDCVTEDGFDAMIKAGINNMVLGVESASSKVLKVMNKGITLEKAEDACKKAVGKGLIVGAFWIIGHPGDSPHETQITIDAIERFYRKGLTKTSEIALFVPYPGTDIFNNPEKFGVRILTFDWEKWGRFNTEPVFELDRFSKEEIIHAWESAKRAAERGKFLAANPPAVASDFPSGKTGRNAPCPCGSGKKYKKCCGR